MDPLSFLILRRISSKIADWIDKLIDLYDHLTFHLTRKEWQDAWLRPGEPGYLPPKTRNER
jgi:hypothetical protein